MSVGVAGSEECQRITFTTNAAGSELATFEITNTTVDSAELTVTRIPEPLDISTFEGASLSGAYLVLPAEEDTETLDYNGVMAHQDAVKIGPIDNNTEFWRVMTETALRREVQPSKRHLPIPLPA